MRWYFRCLLLAALLGTVTALPARACINDREVKNSEQEFKSSYQDQPAPPPPAPDYSPPSTGDQVKTYGAMSLGGLLFLGAAVQTFRKPRRGQV